jgi:hypothetical protein
MVDAAEEQARARIAEAQHRVDELVEARARVAEQLGRTDAMLQHTLGTLALPPEELVHSTTDDGPWDADPSDAAPEAEPVDAGDPETNGRTPEEPTSPAAGARGTSRRRQRRTTAGSTRR